MDGKAYAAWINAGFDAWALGAEASTVIGLRALRMATGGDPGGSEARLMVSEKVKAGLELQAGLIAEALTLTPLTGTQKVIRHYRRKVAANRRRLAR